MVRDIQPDFSFQDERGKIVQLVHEGYEQVNVLFSNKGVLRGEHYHKVSTESFYILSGEVVVTINANGNENRFVYNEGAFFKVFPGEKHSLYFPEDCWMVALYDKAVEKEDGSKDIYSE